MKPVFFLLCIQFLFACNNGQQAPDVSNSKVRISVQRFEKSFFQLDSNNTRTGLTALQQQYPGFLPLFVNHVLGLGPVTDSNELVFIGVKRFLHLNQPVFLKSQELYSDFSDETAALETAFRYVHHYFPRYRIPAIITTVGPMDALAPMSNNEPSPNYMGEDFLAIGLQFYLGSDYTVYNDPGFITNVVPTYRSRRFSQEYLCSDVMKLVIDDLYPDSSARLPLGEQFVEKGKRLELLSRFLPTTNDTLLLGYTKEQLNWCRNNERSIYNFFAQNNLLYERDPGLTQPYLTEGPFTQGMPETSPGNIGAFLGWQIMKAFLKKQKDLTPEEFMKLPAGEIIRQAGYKPR
jgi:hypothetical protein